MYDEPDPPRKFYKLAEAKFDRVNEAAPEAAITPISDQARETPATEPSKENDVHKILLENRAVDKAAGWFDVSYRPKRPSRRKRDYWLLLITVNLFFGAPLAYFGVKSIPGFFALGGIIFCSISLTWVMWFIVGDY
jgi:hypothetical protein